MVDATVLFNAEDWSIIEFHDRNGVKKKIEGFVENSDGNRTIYNCPTDKCGALCCTKISWDGSPGPCEFLDENKQCGFHTKGGIGMKPSRCAFWPLTQESVDGFNARHASGDVKCYLTVVDA